MSLNEKSEDLENCAGHRDLMIQKYRDDYSQMFQCRVQQWIGSYKRNWSICRFVGVGLSGRRKKGILMKTVEF